MINKDKLERIYHTFGTKKTAEIFGVTQKTIYQYLKKYDIKKNKDIKTKKWFDELPGTVKEYNDKWKNVKYRNWWGCGD